MIIKQMILFCFYYFISGNFFVMPSFYLSTFSQLKAKYKLLVKREKLSGRIRDKNDFSNDNNLKLKLSKKIIKIQNIQNFIQKFKLHFKHLQYKMGDFWKPTSDMFSGLIQKPKMTQKLLSKPPFKYIFDIIMQTTKKTGFGKGLYTGQQLNGDYYKDRDTKITFLAKIIQLTEMMGGMTVQAKPQKIVAGLQAQATNLMLQDIYKVATSGQNSDPYVKKVLSGGTAQQQQEQVKKKEPQNKKIQRPPSAARLKKPNEQPASKKNVQQQEPVQQPSKKQIEQKKQPVAAKKQQYSKKVQELMEEGQQQAANEKSQKPKQEQPQQSKNKLGNLRKKKKTDKVGEGKILASGAELNEKQLQMLQSMIQSICQNTAPLGKSIQFINDDVQAMNKQLQFWRRQYNASKGKMQTQLKVTQQSLLPVYDKIAQIQDQIKDQKAKIQNAKAQIIKNDSTIRDLLMSVVTTK